MVPTTQESIPQSGDVKHLCRCKGTPNGLRCEIPADRYDGLCATCRRRKADERIEDRMFAAAKEIVGPSPPTSRRTTRRTVRQINRRIRGMYRWHRFATPFSWLQGSYLLAQAALMAVVASRACPGTQPLTDSDLVAAAVVCGMRRRGSERSAHSGFVTDHCRAMFAAANRARAAAAVN